MLQLPAGLTAASVPPVPDPDPLAAFFWDAVTARRLEILRCVDCGHYVHYPRPICDRCLGESLRPSPVSGRGTLYAYTEVMQAFHPYFVDKLPYYLAVVELEEEPGLKMTTNLVDVHDRAALRHGRGSGLHRGGARVRPTDVPTGALHGEPQVRERRNGGPAVERTRDRPPGPGGTGVKTTDRVAAVGVGYSTTGRATGLTSWQLAVQAAKAALDDAGLTPDDIDGVCLLWGVAGPAPAGLDPVDPMDLGYMLGIRGLNWYGTAGPAYVGPAIQAVTAIRAGMAHTVLTLRIIRQRLSSSQELSRASTMGPIPAPG